MNHVRRATHSSHGVIDDPGCVVNGLLDAAQGGLGLVDGVQSVVNSRSGRPQGGHQLLDGCTTTWGRVGRKRGVGPFTRLSAMLDRPACS